MTTGNVRLSVQRGNESRYVQNERNSLPFFSSYKIVEENTSISQNCCMEIEKACKECESCTRKLPDGIMETQVSFRKNCITVNHHSGKEGIKQ